MSEATAYTYATSGRSIVPSDNQAAYMTRAETELQAITQKTKAEIVALGYEWNFYQAAFAVMDALFLADQQSGKASESLGGYSVSYATQGSSSPTYTAARPYLLPTGLLFGGCWE